MTSMFWGLRLEPGKRYSTTVDKSFHVSMAALDCSSLKSDNEILSVMLEEDEANVPYILCNLSKQKVLQSRLDLNFMTGDRVTFFCKGNGVVHLSGYIVPDDEEFGNIGEEDEDEEVDEEAEEEEEANIISKGQPKGKGKLNGIKLMEKRKPEDSPARPHKKKKIEQEADSEDSNEDEEDDEDLDDLADLEDDFEGTEEEEEEESVESDDDEDSDEEEMEIQVNTPQQQKKDKKKSLTQQQQSTPNSAKKPGQQQPTPKPTPGKTPKTANGLSTPNQASAKKDKKKQGESPASTPKGNKSTSEEPSPQKKVLEGGVMVKDLKVGNGPVCKAGKMAAVYYTGRLKSNNKVFDSTLQGPGFKFRVGRGEVIKGWDVGLQGMKVGGKRLITCPPQMGYGAKGSPPTIPGNSTLVFEVELKGVN